MLRNRTTSAMNMTTASEVNTPLHEKRSDLTAFAVLIFYPALAETYRLVREEASRYASDRFRPAVTSVMGGLQTFLAHC